MPKRGSVRFLLLFLRPRVMLGLGLAAVASAGLVAGLVQTRDGFPLLEDTRLSQVLRQSAWEHALAGQPNAERWPWEDANMSLAPGAKVPRLGLSAAFLDLDTAETHAPGLAQSDRAADAKAAKPGAAEGDIALGDVADSGVKIGDSITVTAADGAVCAYRVTGRDVVDPHLAESEAGPIDGAVSVFECGPLESLIRQATQGAPSQAPIPAAPIDEQQKL